MVPSDPDFPFDIEALECVLGVPSGYPPGGKPTLRVTNQEMPRGFQLNVERGFDHIAGGSPNATLLGLMNRLDTQLEKLLSGQMLDTIKIVRNAPTPSAGETPKLVTLSAPPKQPEAILPDVRVVNYTPEQKVQAQAKRQADIRQLIARLGKLANFSQLGDGVTFTVPFEPPRRNDWPEALRGLRTLRLIVPELYNLQPCRIELPGISDPSARQIERSFEQRAQQNPDATLLTHVNHMSQHMKAMATAQAEATPQLPTQSVEVTTTVDSPRETSSTSAVSMSNLPEEKAHVQHIPRPPEWALPNAEDEVSSDDDSFTYDSGDETEDEDQAGNASADHAPTSTPAERGVLLSFPHLELHGIELLELVSLNIAVKCERCKDLLDVERIRNNVRGDYSGMRDESCKRCANNLAIGYRMDMMHANSARAGYLDLDGCTVVDMLPSNFVPTCSECSTPYPAPGVVSVRGESAMAICRECHRRMSFRIPEIKFLMVSAAAIRASRGPTRKKIKEKLGIIAGQELPRRGRCSHYSKSYRWFR